MLKNKSYWFLLFIAFVSKINISYSMDQKNIVFKTYTIEQYMLDSKLKKTLKINDPCSDNYDYAACLLLKDANPNLVFKSKLNKIPITSVLIFIIRSNSFINLLNLLFNKNVDLNFQDELGYTALSWASYLGNVNMVKLLIDAGADLNIKDNDGYTALMISLQNECNDIIKLLIDAGANLDIKDNNDCTVLMQALKNEQINMVQLFIDAGADLNIKNKNGDTILISSILYNNIHVTEMILNSEQYCDVNSMNATGDTALTFAIKKHGRFSVINYLLGYNYKEFIKLLLSNRYLNINAQDYEGNTALMLAIKLGKIDIVRLLLSDSYNLSSMSDININIKNNNGDTLLSLVRQNNYKDVEEYLISKYSTNIYSSSYLIDDNLAEKSV